MNMIDHAHTDEVMGLIERALAEDIGAGDITSQALIPADLRATGAIVSRLECVVCGVTTVAMVFRKVDKALDVTVHKHDGQRAAAGETLMTVSGSARAILAGERTALNFLQRLSGIATLTDAFVKRAGRYHARILDTRKTTPGLRVLEKYAVRCGGGHNHRMGLYDMVLIKDNHRKLWGAITEWDLGEAVSAARGKSPGVQVEVEVESEEELLSALSASPDWILLDNMSVDLMKKCVERCGGRCRLEASGGITLENVEQVAATGVDAISLGCLTHSAPAADLSLELVA